MPISLDHWILTALAFGFGACVGSFLNVVIYRVPLGMSVNEPKRSFCPHCKAGIPMWLNIPLLSWVWLRGKCRNCQAPISVRYVGVELLTALLFGVVWHGFGQAPQVVLPLFVLVSLLVALTFIDAEHLIIPTRMTTAGTVVGLVACGLWPSLPVLAGVAGTRLEAVLAGGIGLTVGFLGLWAVVELGKRAFGRKAMTFEKPTAWMLREAGNDVDPLCFVIDGDAIPWWDMFARKTDRLVVQTTALRVNGKDVDAGELVIRENEITLPDGHVLPIETLQSLDGMAVSAVVPREAMGFGDVHLLGMLGAFLGWSGVLFSLFAASLYAIAWAVAGRIGFGRQLPFGPFLALGGLTWLFGGWKLWQWYVAFVLPVG
jgi:leader peptidase (prepilin peptidase) / N-methyltransferase